MRYDRFHGIAILVVSAFAGARSILMSKRATHANRRRVSCKALLHARRSRRPRRGCGDCCRRRGSRASAGERRARSGVGRLRLARLRRSLVRPAAGIGPRTDQAGSRLSLPRQSRRPRASDAGHRLYQGPGSQALGRQADAGVQRRGAERQARASLRGSVDLPSRRGARATADPGPTVLFHPDAPRRSGWSGRPITWCAAST